MRKFKSVRNGQIAELVSENEQQVTIRLEESEEERNISPATLKRWWKPYEEESVTEEPQTEEITQEEPAEEITEFKKMSHMFDARVQFSEDNKTTRDKITKLLDVSLEFQKNKQAAKASK